MNNKSKKAGLHPSGKEGVDVDICRPQIEFTRVPCFIRKSMKGKVCSLLIDGVPDGD
jgi:hypothetical protein